MKVNQLVKRAATCRRERPRFAYIAPTYRQGKAIAWDYLKHYTAPIPGIRANESELWVELPNTGQVRIYGADNPDALRGIYLDGTALDEYGLMPPKIFTEVVRPALADREGWACFIGTPNGKNQFWDIAEHARTEPDWYFAAHKASETNILPDAELADARRLMTSEEYAQEFECSFEASVKGAIYGAELAKAREEKRVTKVLYERTLPVVTAWDLGMRNSTAIWFAQFLGVEIRLIDYYESSGEGLQHYVGVINQKGYAYSRHIAPHDIEVRELGSGKSRKEIGQSLGIHFEVAPNLPLEDGINATRMAFNRVWLDEEKCKAGIDALMNYRRDYNTRLNEFKATPVDDWASHGADALRYLILAQDRAHAKPKPIKYSNKGIV